MSTSGWLAGALASVVEQTAASSRGRPPVLFLRAAGGWQLIGLLTGEAGELRMCVEEATRIVEEERVRAFMCVARVEDARRIAAHLWGEPAPAQGELAVAAAAVGGERLAGVTGASWSWCVPGTPDAGADELCRWLERLLLGS